ncbi:hypothetical protein ABID23_000144 [Bartonella silvatica]|uniref:Alkaline proteinase inhibitor/ Outer membrane lipoprotein Omp19 domain-containing protein n=1 Tax=Bartonella silvatica TaxID=357760 RepID=A0ABV2HF47_9HYPH
MSFSKILLLVVLLAVTLLEGCSTLRFDSDDRDNAVEASYSLHEIPTFEIISDSPSSRSLRSETEDVSMYERGSSQSDGQMASLELPGNAIELFPASIAGVWKLSVSGKTCRIATPQTKFGQGYRAGPLNCPGIISQVNSWGIKGKRLYFYNNSGRVIVALYSSDIDRFEGRTLDNHLVILSR